MNRPYTILEHPSDLGIEAYGTTVADAFRNAARGLMSVILDVDAVREREFISITVEAVDTEQLLVRFLDEILFRYDGEKFATGDVAFTHFSDTSLAATLLGERFDPSLHAAKLDVKAITYHQLGIMHEEGKARVRVFVDI